MTMAVRKNVPEDREVVNFSPPKWIGRWWSVGSSPFCWISPPDLRKRSALSCGLIWTLEAQVRLSFGAPAGCYEAG